MLQDSDTSGPKGSSYRDPKTDLAQVVEKDPDAEILRKWSCRNLKRILIQVVLEDRDTSGPKGSSYRDLVQVVVQDSDRSGRKGPAAEILHKWSYRIMQEVQKDLHTGS